MEQSLTANKIDIDSILKADTKKKFTLFKKKNKKETNNDELKDVLKCIIDNQNAQAKKIMELSNKMLLLNSSKTDNNSTNANNNNNDDDNIIDIIFEELKITKIDEDAKNTSVRLYPSVKDKLEELYKMYPDFNRQDILNQLILEGYNKYKKI